MLVDDISSYILFPQGSEPVVIMLDGNGALYPVSRDCVGMVREPPPLNLPPARAITVHALPLQPHGAHHSQHTALKSQVNSSHNISSCFYGIVYQIALNINISDVF